MLIQQITPTFNKVQIQDLSCLNSPYFPLKPFDENVIHFSGRISKRILEDQQFGREPALVALAYWLRPSNISRIVKENQYLTQNKNIKLSPIGIVFHVCPANVDTMFIYSLMVSILMGNKNVLRVSNRLDHEYISFLFNILNEELATKESNLFVNYINIVSYDHESDINIFFAEKSNARLIWGGDNTAKVFKNIVGNPRCKDIVFADRISISIFNTSKFLIETKESQIKIVKDFYNDAFTFDQKGCSSPQSIIMFGSSENNLLFLNLFYNLLGVKSSMEFEVDSASLSTLKFNHLIGDVIESKVTSYKNDFSSLYFVISSTDSKLYHSCGGGYFYINEISELEGIISLINNKVQTISYYGLNQREIEFLADKTAGLGVDRIVPVGNALNFDYIWDGYNLCEELSIRKFIQ